LAASSASTSPAFLAKPSSSPGARPSDDAGSTPEGSAVAVTVMGGSPATMEAPESSRAVSREAAEAKTTTAERSGGVPGSSCSSTLTTSPL